MKLKTSEERARKLILSIPHKTCTGAIDRHWKVNVDGTVPAQSVLWLFCWAKTGMNSQIARQESVRVFDEIFPIPFSAFDAVVDHEYARKGRYLDLNIDRELEDMLVKAQTE
jgi:hypothetical protein